jgi:hypothetical protein
MRLSLIVRVANGYACGVKDRQLERVLARSERSHGGAQLFERSVHQLAAADVVLASQTLR